MYRHACDRGHAVVAASRHPLGNDVPWVPYDLTSPAPPQIPLDTDVVIHLAADMRGELSGDIELSAAKALLAATRSVGAKFLFISSQTAREDAPTAYGRTKWRIEQEVLAADGWAVRLGLVYGGAEEGTFGMIAGLVEKLPLLPAFLPPPLVQALHVEDLAQGILNLAENRSMPSGVLSVAEDSPVSYTFFLKAVARYRKRTFKLFVPTPVFLVRAVGRLFPANSVLGKSFTRLTSLFDLPTMDTRRDLEALGLRLRPISIGMMRGKAGVRRQLLEEGAILLRYVLGAAPSSSLLRRYALAMEQLHAGAPLVLPAALQLFPGALALLEKRLLTPGARDDALAFRLHAAVMLAEASPQGAGLFRGKGGVRAAFRDVLGAVMLECAARFLQILVWPFLRAWDRHKGKPRDAGL